MATRKIGARSGHGNETPDGSPTFRRRVQIIETVLRRHDTPTLARMALAVLRELGPMLHNGELGRVSPTVEALLTGEAKTDHRRLLFEALVSDIAAKYPEGTDGELVADLEGDVLAWTAGLPFKVALARGEALAVELRMHLSLVERSEPGAY